MNIKQPHEEGVCKRFFVVYNRENSTTFAFLKAGSPPAPDCLCTNGLNIEVVTAYYNQEAAKELNEAARTNVAPRGAMVMPDADQKGWDAIDQAITNKANKKYVYTGNLWLVVDFEAALADWEDDVEPNYLKAARALPKGLFDEIWLLMKDWAGDHIGRITVQ